MAKPFLKWAGGKTQLMEEILSRRPTTYSRYIEPMVGAGAVFFAIPLEAPSIISDINSELINAYLQVRDNPEPVIQELRSLQQDAASYYLTRSAERSDEFNLWSAPKKAARTIYLNKLGYNGLYRVNKTGFFNVPFGKRTGVDFDNENIRAASAALQNCEILNINYREIKDRIGQDDWVYLDPPYLPINESSNFTKYTPGGFSLEDHRELKKFYDELTMQGTKVLMSNSHSEEVIRMYSEYNISIVFAKRSINSKGHRRGRVPEVLIANY